MRPLSGKRYCIHVFDQAGKPIYYVLSDELVMDGIKLQLQAEMAGAMVWSAILGATEFKTEIVRVAKGRFNVIAAGGVVEAKYVGNGHGPGRKIGGHAWRLILKDGKGSVVKSEKTTAKREDASAVAMRLLSTVSARTKPYVSARAHERRVDSIHIDPEWFCRPIRGRQRKGSEPEAWETKPFVKQQTLVLRCDMCGAEFYPQVPEETAHSIITGKTRAKIPPCKRCGGRLTIEQFTLNTSSGEMPRLQS